MDRSDLPIIFESDTSNLNKGGTSQERSTSNFKKWLPKGIFVVLGIIILVEIVLGIRTLTSPVPSVGKIQPITAGQMILVSDSPQVPVNQPVQVKVRVDTGGHTVSGADLVLKYNPTVLEATKESVIPGGIFEEYPLINVDSQNGIITVSGVYLTSNQGFNGIGDFITVNFTSRFTGNGGLSIDYQPGITTETNLIESSTAQDILESPTPLDLKVI